MRNIFKISALLSLLFIAVSCDKDEDKVVLNSNANVETTLSTDAIVLDKNKPDETALTVSWATQGVNTSLAHTYSIMLEANGKSKEVSVSTSPYSFTHVELNKILLNDLELATGTESQVKITLKDAVSDRYNLPTEAKILKVTPYADLIDPTEWGIVGSATPNGWDGPDLPFWKNPTNSKEFVAYVTLKAGDMKFRKNNKWDDNFGDTGADGSLEAGGSDIPVTAGTYKITWNTEDNTYTIEKYSWGITGNFRNWGGMPDVPLVYDGTTNTWKAENVEINGGNIKFRFNNDWGVNYGDDGKDGTLDAGGADIPVTAGTYTITVDFSVTPPTYTIK